jgi:hypothetical protein
MLFDSTPAEFRSAFDLAESVARLRAATKRSGFASLAETAAVGKVAEDRVSLRRVIPMVRNSFQPIFVGRFAARGGAVVLAGKFTMSPFVKVFTTFWFGMVGVFGLVALLGAPSLHGPHALLFRLQPLLMLGAGMALVAVGKWFARNDAAWLSGVIDAALSDPEFRAPAVGAGAPAGGPPVVLKVAAGFLAISGLLSLLSGVFSAFMPPGIRPLSLLPGAVGEILGLGSIVFSVGVWNRRLWGWWGGVCVLAGSLLTSWFALPGGPAQGQPFALRAVFSAFVAVITVFWAYWWYAQRRHFR